MGTHFLRGLCCAYARLESHAALPDPVVDNLATVPFCLNNASTTDDTMGRLQIRVSSGAGRVRPGSEGIAGRSVGRAAQK